jgi:capsular polysaccharide biosynthesis protein
MANARVVIAPHGAAAVNMVLTSVMEHYIEISFYDPDTKPYFSALAQVLCGAKTHFVASRAVIDSNHQSNHECDLNNLKSVLGILRG